MNSAKSNDQKHPTLGSPFRPRILYRTSHRGSEHVVAVGKKVARYFEPGGALDSQTTDSQYIAQYEEPEDESMNEQRTEWKKLRGGEGNAGKGCGVPGHAEIILRMEKKIDDLTTLVEHLYKGTKIQQVGKEAFAVRPPSHCCHCHPQPAIAFQSPSTPAAPSTPTSRNTQYQGSSNDWYRMSQVEVPTRSGGTEWIEMSQEPDLSPVSEADSDRSPSPYPRNTNVNGAPIRRLRQVHTGDEVEYYVSETPTQDVLSAPTTFSQGGRTIRNEPSSHSRKRYRT